jgi:hypothetical protein
MKAFWRNFLRMLQREWFLFVVLVLVFVIIALFAWLD